MEAFDTNTYFITMLALSVGLSATHLGLRLYSKIGHCISLHNACKEKNKPAEEEKKKKKQEEVQQKVLETRLSVTGNAIV